MSARRRDDTAQRILDVAERLVQVQGFNAFSYADVSAELKIQKASLHHHFATKAELGQALIERYHQAFIGALAEIESEQRDAPARLERYVKLYSGVLKKGRMCLCGMLASDFETLPRPMRTRVNQFFTANEQWLARVLDGGRKDKALSFRGAPGSVAQHLVATLEGAMLVARSYGSAARFETVARRLLAELQ